MESSVGIHSTHHSLRGYGTWDMEVPAAPGRGQAVGQHLDTDIDLERVHTRGQTSGRVKRWAGGWYRRWCVLDEPAAGVGKHIVCTRNCPGP
jgi:hypothetical protein